MKNDSPLHEDSLLKEKVHEIKVPVLPESVADAIVISWYKHPGDEIKQDEPIVDIETDKVVLEVPAPVSGVLEKIIENNGSTVLALQVLGILIEKPVGQKTAASNPVSESVENKETQTIITPAAHKMIVEHKLDPDTITGSGKGGRVLKEDVALVLEKTAIEPEQVPPPIPEFIKNTERPATNKAVPSGGKQSQFLSPVENKINTADFPEAPYREERRIPMTRLRARIAQRLLEAQQNAAILSTFNEVNMQPVMDLRSRYKDLFEQTHQVKLGFMSFFVKAVVDALKQFPVVNASIDGNDIVYHGYFDIGVAVSSPRGLVVPVLKNAQHMTMADIEKNIKDFAVKAKENRLTLDEITGGTFSITNGGVFGSLLSTPILNPPQSGILGMHTIQERPVVEKGEIVIRPIMYLALSYDHRIIDGREAVQFLVAIKNAIEDPSRMLLEI
ncbi:MAG: 2-oxoglutarate dehydrogenase complex dihydrolipoyllysine-residue succinyltransferase [Gammaproteobacteria bacterium]|nr:2-oxoglutarate dehydrogenase complex dihydrolipoyllysine-residue succinyltransferase [Gammaproteobacteria bacterium]